jgi:DNA-binding protein H-NS
MLNCAKRGEVKDPNDFMVNQSTLERTLQAGYDIQNKQAERIRKLEAALRETQRQYQTHCEVFLGEEIQERIDELLGSTAETKGDVDRGGKL